PRGRIAARIAGGNPLGRSCRDEGQRRVGLLQSAGRASGTAELPRRILCRLGGTDQRRRIPQRGPSLVRGIVEHRHRSSATLPLRASSPVGKSAMPRETLFQLLVPAETQKLVSTWMWLEPSNRLI